MVVFILTRYAPEHMYKCIYAIKLIVCFTLWAFTIKAFSRKSFAFWCNQTCNHYLNIYLLCAVSCIAVPHVTLNLSLSILPSLSPFALIQLHIFKLNMFNCAHTHTCSSMGASEWNFNYILSHSISLKRHFLTVQYWNRFFFLVSESDCLQLHNKSNFIRLMCKKMKCHWFERLGWI